MRSLLFCILLVLPATAAAAPGINLFWSDCGLTPGNTNQNFACNLNFGPPHRLVMSIVPDALIDRVTGVNGLIEIQFDAAVVPDYWKLQPEGPRAGALLIDPFFGSSGPFSCSEPWSQAGGQSGSVTYLAGSPSLLPNRAQILWSVSVPGEVVIDPAVVAEWYLAALNVLRTGTTSVTGCTVPACLVFTEITLVRTPGAVGGNLTICSPSQNQHITWQGGGTVNCPWGHGPPIPAPCPGATPARANTWGEIKQMYR